MAFNDYETSQARGKPVMLYLFLYGVQSDGITPIYLAHTDGETEVTHTDPTYGAITYTPLPIKQSDIETNGKMEKNEVRIDVPIFSALSDLFRVFPPGQVVTVKVRQGHIANADDPVGWATGENFPVVWLGRVLEAARQGRVTTLTCESAAASMKRTGLRRHYQWACPLVLYGTRCQASKVAAQTTGTVLSVAGNTITLAGTWQKQVPVDPDADPIVYEDIGASNYTGGLVEWQGSMGVERHSILRVSGTHTLVLTGPVRDLAATDEVTIALGCPHTLTGCETIHENAVNYGGHPFIPTFNPVYKNNHT